MGKHEMRQKVIRRISRFEITKQDIDKLIRTGNFLYSPDRDPSCGEPYASIKKTIESFSERKRYDLMCLMYLGRNIAYTGFTDEAVEDFCFYADAWKKYAKLGKKVPYGGTDSEYLAGKRHIARWLILVKEALQPSCWN